MATEVNVLDFNDIIARKQTNLLQRGLWVANGPVDVAEVVQINETQITDELINTELNSLFARIEGLYVGKSVTILNKEGSLFGFYYLSRETDEESVNLWKPSAVLN